MKLSIKSLLTPVTHRAGASVALFVLAGSLILPTPLSAKEKSAEKPQTVKHVTKKRLETKKSAKATRVRIGKKTTKRAHKEHSKQTSKKLEKTRKLIEKNKKLHKTSKLKTNSSVKASKKNRHTKHGRRHANAIPSSFAWQPSSEPRQAYYQIPPQDGANQPAYRQTSMEVPQQQEQKPVSSRPAHVGTASYYSDKFNGGRTASGERLDQNKLTCAHGSLPFGCKIRVTNLRNNKSVDVKVNDRGGFSNHGRVVDLTKAAAREIGMVGAGTAKVKVEVLE
jgi:rare lipoprotein A